MRNYWPERYLSWYSRSQGRRILMNMNLKKNSVTIMMVLTMLMASLAGCLGGDNTDNTEQKVINIAGSSTVFPVASAWGQAYSMDLSLIHI